MTPALAIQMAEELRSGRVRLSRASPSDHRPIGYSWLSRFRNRHPDISGAWSRPIDRDRFNGANREAIQRWFDAVSEQYAQHQYPPDRIYNMDESGFAVGAGQSSRVLVSVHNKTSWKKITGRSEWITAIECVNAAGIPIAPMLIYKSKFLHSGWIPDSAPPEWCFSTSTSGWTSDELGFEWITRVFEPNTRPDDPSQRRLLIMDGHGSHMTAKLVAFAMEHAIDLMIFPPHSTHALQPLDICLFGPLKRALARETDAITRLSDARIPRVEWTKAYISARTVAFSVKNIEKAFESTGLWPLSPIEVLQRYPEEPPQARIQTQPTANTDPMDLSMLDSSPPDTTELSAANQVLNATIDASPEVPAKAKRFIRRQGQAIEKLNSELIALRAHSAKQDELLKARKKIKRGKRVAVEGVFVFSREDIHRKLVEAEAETQAKAAKKKRSKAKPEPIPISDDEQASEKASDSSDSDCILVGVE